MNGKSLDDIFDLNHHYKITIVFNQAVHDTDNPLYEHDLAVRMDALCNEISWYADEASYVVAKPYHGDVVSEYAYDRIVTDFTAGRDDQAQPFSFENIEEALIALLTQQAPFKDWDLKEVKIERRDVLSDQTVQSQTIDLRMR